jgi:hypothetical protein
MSVDVVASVDCCMYTPDICNGIRYASTTSAAKSATQRLRI